MFPVYCVTHVPGLYPLHDQLVDALQRLESLLALHGRGPRVRRIRWDVPTTEWIPESPEEHKYAEVAQVSYSTRPRIPRSDLSANSFEIMIQNADRYESLRTLAAFFRQAIVDFESGQYIQSCYNFYFVLEDMFAHGRSDEDRIYEAFSSEVDLTACLEASISSLPRDKNGNHAQLLALMSEEGFDWHLEDLRRFIIRLRNRLHHYRGRSPKRQGTPFSQSDFRPAALLMMHIATCALFTRAVQLNKQFGPPKGPPPEHGASS